MRLRDIEVANDDIERQARNTTSSLEDLESKYNVSIERGVMFEEEIRAGELEREALRIETQRLRDELSDLRVEAEVRQGQLRNAEDRQRSRKPTPIEHSTARPPTRGSQHSPATSNSSPTIATPPTKSASSTVSETPTPPSPPTSDHSAPIPPKPELKAIPRSRLSMADSNVTPRPSTSSSQGASTSWNPALPKSSKPTPYQPRRSTIYRQDNQASGPGLPASGSLHQIRGLIGKMQKLEQRVNSARSKLPAPTTTPPRSSPRSSSAMGQAAIPGNITMRSNKKRTGGSNASSALPQTSEQPRRPSSRLSFGIPQTSPSRRTTTMEPPEQPQRPHSRLSFGLPQSSPNRGANTIASRPSSRASITSRPSISHLASASTVSSSSRPGSRQSNTDAHTPLGHYSSVGTMSESRRPRSSIGGSYAATHYGHGHSASVSRLSNYGSQTHDDGYEEENSEVLTPTPATRGTFGKGDQGSAIPAFSASSAKRRISGLGPGRRTSSGAGPKEEGNMGPPERRSVRKLSGVGETF